MALNSFIYLLIGALACTIGAIPFGLVNLTVMEISIKENIRKSMSVAYGAALVELMFALTALVAGTMLSGYFNGNMMVKYIVLAVLVVSGVFFWFKKSNPVNEGDSRHKNGFLKGILLNLMSIQVLLFWLFAVTFLSVRNLFPSSLIQFSLFIAGVWIGKMVVLYSYALLGSKIITQSQLISQNINRIIGFMLVAISVVQFIKH
ncbi:MAG: hypothetical protein CVU14_02985 [Bacteroidetes bacterium HGW-Bacteroidetes-9]|jgi:threonine/homoserine/homoserine lactone efflux protein|nr:MAG: hypothetical protein CVU14_02985 [Bacteroidetes bacterium HGW-Bacteroidetes-9]